VSCITQEGDSAKLLIGDDLGMATRAVLGVQFPPLRLSNSIRPR